METCRAQSRLHKSHVMLKTGKNTQLQVTFDLTVTSMNTNQQSVLILIYCGTEGYTPYPKQKHCPFNAFA